MIKISEPHGVDRECNCDCSGTGCGADTGKHSAYDPMDTILLNKSMLFWDRLPRWISVYMKYEMLKYVISDWFSRLL